MVMSPEQLLAPINNFLQCQTPQAWIEKAKQPENFSDDSNRSFDM